MRFLRTMFILGMVVTVLAIGDLPAQGNQIEVKFTATNFLGRNGLAPTDPVRGNIIYEAASRNAKIDDLISIQMIIDRHFYSLTEVGFYSSSTHSGIYGLVNGTGIMTNRNPGWNRNDFSFGWAKDSFMPTWFIYSSSLRDGDIPWSTKTFSSFTVRDISAVPETTTLLFLISGLLGILVYGRKRVL